MPQGPGKYDALTTYVRRKSDALGAIVIVIEGNKGSGFSVQATPELTRSLPKMLRSMADEIDRDMGSS